MIELAIDIETYSETDIKFGVHKYVEDRSFDILLCAYSINNESVEIFDLACGEKLSKEFLSLLRDPRVLKTAYNASFEITCFNRYLGDTIPTNQWSCTQALAAQAGLPFGLDNVAKVLKTVEQKDSKGKDLIKYFTMSCKPTKSNGMRKRNLPEHNFNRWLDFKYYNCQDVKTEQSIRRSLDWFEIADFEKSVWELDQKINNRGVLISKELAINAVRMEAITTDKLCKELTDLTGIDNPKSNTQVKKFIFDSTGEEIKSLSKSNIEEVNKLFKGTDTEHILSIREKLNRTSIKKYTAMLNSVCVDGRIRGLFQYYGANRTGRFAGRNVQLQNLTRNNLDNLDLARTLVQKNDLTSLELIYGDPGYVLSNLVRTAFVAKPGHIFNISDLNSIEARILAWLANEEWKMKVFATHGKIYEASASMMFKVPIEKITKSSDLRTKGKISELALGYQGSVGALERMGGASMGLSQSEMLVLVKQWRQSNKKIVKLWYDVQDRVIEAITEGYSELRNLKFYTKNKNLIIELPSKRKLVYISCKFSNNKISYFGMDQVTKKWCEQDTYGGKLVENIVQAIARDVMVDIMKRLDLKGFRIVMHVHDEIVSEDLALKNLEKEMTATMIEPISWAKGLVLGAETFTSKYYKK